MKKFSQISQLNDSNKNTVSCDCYDLDDFNKVVVTKQDLAVLISTFLHSVPTLMKLLLLSPLCMNDVFKLADQNTTATKTSLFKFSQPLRKTHHGQKSLSYVAPSI